MDIVEAEGLTKVFRDQRALDGLSFAVARGAIFGLLGPNGAGKTTTLRILTTLMKPTAGRASVCGYDVERQPKPVRERIGFVMQEVALDRALTGRENLELQANLYHLPRRGIRRRVGEVLSLVDLEDAAGRPVEEYSGGMKKRLDLAAGLLHQPSLLVLDEPSLGLDVHSRHRVWEHIRWLREQGTTILLATNYLDEAEQLCDRLIIVDAGKTVAEGTPDSLKASVAADVIDLEIEGDASDFLPGLGEMSEVKRTVETDGHLHIYVADAAMTLPGLIRAADAGGLLLRSVSYKQPSLDDVFLLRTGRQIRETDE